MEIRELGYESVVVALDMSDLEWLAAAARIGNAAAQGYGIRRNAAGPTYGVTAEEAARRYSHYHDLLFSLARAVRADDADEEPIPAPAPDAENAEV